MNELYAAALLHDIGKFYMRTEDKQKKNELKKEYINIYILMKMLLHQGIRSGGQAFVKTSTLKTILL
ncbi:MAG: hypothetical protein N2448_06510 [Caloramator sp.]|nr:hypothetical protein [Caloramator sp.]